MKKDSKVAIVYNKLKKIFYVLFNLTYVGAFIAYTVYQFYNKNQTITWLPYVLIAITLVYFISFLFVIFQKDDEQAEREVKTYKKSLKIFKKLLKLSNLVMSAVMITNTVMFDPHTFSFALAVANIIIVILQILKSLKKMIKKEKKEKIKAEKKELKQGMVDDIKGMIEEDAVDESEPISKKEAMQKKVTTVTNNADKIAKRVVQYNSDKKSVGKKKKK